MNIIDLLARSNWVLFSYLNLGSTFSLLCVNKFINNHSEYIWIAKWCYDYSDKHYFAKWSAKENYLVRLFKKFMIVPNDQDDGLYLDKPLYQYSILLKDTISNFISSDYVKNESGLVHPVVFDVESKYILFYQNDIGVASNTYTQEFKVLGQYSTINEAIERIKRSGYLMRPITSLINKEGWESSETFYIYDIEAMVPAFTHLRKMKDSSNERALIYKHYFEGKTYKDIKWFNEKI